MEIQYTLSTALYQRLFSRKDSRSPAKAMEVCMLGKQFNTVWYATSGLIIRSSRSGVPCTYHTSWRRIVL
ncbi:hypothetical protein D3C75_1147270 [compost metagenome]